MASFCIFTIKSDIYPRRATVRTEVLPQYMEALRAERPSRLLADFHELRQGFRAASCKGQPDGPKQRCGLHLPDLPTQIIRLKPHGVREVLPQPMEAVSTR